MANQCIAQTPSAYGFPLLIKGLLESGVTRDPEQEIVSADCTRLTRTLRYTLVLALTISPNATCGV
jgi:hypothetical protein